MPAFLAPLLASPWLKPALQVFAVLLVVLAIFVAGRWVEGAAERARYLERVEQQRKAGDNAVDDFRDGGGAAGRLREGGF